MYFVLFYINVHQTLSFYDIYNISIKKPFLLLGVKKKRIYHFDVKKKCEKLGDM
jgi:hypothetical protein